MVDMFISQLTHLLPCHLTEKWVRYLRPGKIFILTDQAYPFVFFRNNITIPFYYKFRKGWRAVLKRGIVFQHAL